MLIFWKTHVWTGLGGILFTLLIACTTPSQTVTTPAASPAGVTTEAMPTAIGTTPSRILTVMTHDSFQVSEDVLAEFENHNQATVRFLKSGDTGTALNKAILSKGVPLADVFYGVDNTFLSRALKEGIFEPYASPLLAEIPDQFELDPDMRALPVDYGDVCLNYDIAYFEQNQLVPPTNLDDLLKEEYKNLLVVENPATSSPGLAFLLATIGHYSEDGYLEYWQGLVINGVLVVNDWNTAYYTEFTRVGGTRPIVVSYGSSPPAEVIFAEEPLEAPPTAAVTSDGSCFRQIEFVGILKGTHNRPLAEAWIDFMLSPSFQEDMPLQMFVFPVNPNAQLDETFEKYLANPDNPISISPEAIAKNRERWIQAWTEVVLR
ncbi:MAG TPA: thiamine ABC transporter substrate-binding protein [Anaerolineales bacterium]|nr:thiamine ABC transporter substrate-binding protein [Anaerolineales bacterium]